MVESREIKRDNDHMKNEIGKLSYDVESQKNFIEEYVRSQREYEGHIKEFIAHPLTHDGELYYPTTESGLEGPRGYFEPRADGSFYEIDNPWSPNDDEEVHIDKFKDRVMEDKKKWRVVLLDLMGAGAGTEVADHVFSVSLAERKSGNGYTHMTGDCLSKERAANIRLEVRRFLEEYAHSSRPAILHTIFFRPLRALGYFRNNLYGISRMFEELAEWYKLQPMGGRIYFQAPSDEVLDLFEETLRAHGIQHVLTRHPTGSLMTRIIKDASAQTLPSFSQSPYSQKLMAICLNKKSRNTS